MLRRNNVERCFKACLCNLGHLWVSPDSKLRLHRSNGLSWKLLRLRNTCGVAKFRLSVARPCCRVTILCLKPDGESFGVLGVLLSGGVSRSRSFAGYFWEDYQVHIEPALTWWAATFRPVTAITNRCRSPVGTGTVDDQNGSFGFIWSLLTQKLHVPTISVFHKQDMD